MSKSEISFNSEAVKKLAEILNETNLTEIEYEQNGCRIYVSRHNLSPSLPVQHGHPAPHTAMQAHPAAHYHAAHPTSAHTDTHQQTASKPQDFSTHPGVVKSPMVGTVYVASEPGSAPFVKVGDTISAGQTLLIIEAMKVMNPLKAPKAGKITQILISDASPVEYGQPLIVVE